MYTQGGIDAEPPCSSENTGDCIFTSFELPLGFKEAEAYRKANGQYLRKNQWRDTTARVLIDLD